MAYFKAFDSHYFCRMSLDPESIILYGSEFARGISYCSSLRNDKLLATQLCSDSVMLSRLGRRPKRSPFMRL